MLTILISQNEPGPNKEIYHTFSPSRKINLELEEKIKIHPTFPTTTGIENCLIFCKNYKQFIFILKIDFAFEWKGTFLFFISPKNGKNSFKFHLTFNLLFL